MNFKKYISEKASSTTIKKIQKAFEETINNIDFDEQMHEGGYINMSTLGLTEEFLDNVYILALDIAKDKCIEAFNKAIKK